jgi:hypothetical protein
MFSSACSDEPVPGIGTIASASRQASTSWHRSDGSLESARRPGKQPSVTREWGTSWCSATPVIPRGPPVSSGPSGVMLAAGRSDRDRSRDRGCSTPSR